MNGVLWLSAEAETGGETWQYYIGAVSGTVVILTGTEAAVPAMEGVLAALTVE